MYHLNIIPLYPFMFYFLFILVSGIVSKMYLPEKYNQFINYREKDNLFMRISGEIVWSRTPFILLGVTGMVYTYGPSMMWMLIGILLGDLLMWYIFSRPLRTYGSQLKNPSLLTFFDLRVKDEDGFLRLMTAVCMAVFVITWLAAHLAGMGKAFFAFTNIRWGSGITITLVLVLFHVYLGEIPGKRLAVMLQVGLMVFIFVGLPIIGIVKVGGWEESYLYLYNRELGFFNLRVFTGGVLLSMFSIGLASWGNPRYLNRFLQADEREAKITMLSDTGWTLVMSAGALFLGSLAFRYYPFIHYFPAYRAENAYIRISRELVSRDVNAVLLAGIMMAVLQLSRRLIVSTSETIRVELYEKIFMKDKFIPKSKMKVVYYLIPLVLVYISGFLAIIVRHTEFFNIVLFSWAVGGAAFGPTVLLALFSDRMTPAGLSAGMSSAVLTVVVWKAIPALDAMFYELVPGMVVGFVVSVLVSIVEYWWDKRKARKVSG